MLLATGWSHGTGKRQFGPATVNAQEITNAFAGLVNEQDPSQISVSALSVG